MARDKEGDVLTYVLLGTDAVSFTIDVATGQLRTKAPLDHDPIGDAVKISYSVEVRATDPFAAFATGRRLTLCLSYVDIITVVIAVTNVQEAPEFTAGETTIPHDENLERRHRRWASPYVASDPEDTAAPGLTLSGDDSGKFALSSSGVLTFKVSPNFESPGDANEDNAYEVSVVATDGDAQTSRRDVTVTVTNVNEPGMVTQSAVQPRVGVPITASLTDPDGDISDLTWLWSKDRWHRYYRRGRLQVSHLYTGYANDFGARVDRRRQATRMARVPARPRPGSWKKLLWWTTGTERRCLLIRTQKPKGRQTDQDERSA